jgi:hypothetical protein
MTTPPSSTTAMSMNPPKVFARGRRTAATRDAAVAVRKADSFSADTDHMKRLGKNNITTPPIPATT